MNTKWRRVNREKRCPVCGRADWCLLSDDGTAALCARTESNKRCGDAGWLHRMVDKAWRSPVGGPRSVQISCGLRGRDDLAALAKQFQSAVNSMDLYHHARQLGLTVTSLNAIGIGWTGRAWSFPMIDASGNTLGIRLRFPDGQKLAVKGGKEGLFIPTFNDDNNDDPFLICEGPTDTAALLDMGFHQVIGRPNCTGGIKLLVELAGNRQPREIVILADGDEPGLRGAENLASVMVLYAPSVKVIKPPEGIKDARAWLQAGGTRTDVEAAIQEAPVRRLVMRTRKVVQR